MTFEEIVVQSLNKITEILGKISLELELLKKDVEVFHKESKLDVQDDKH